MPQTKRTSKAVSVFWPNTAHPQVQVVFKKTKISAAEGFEAIETGKKLLSELADFCRGRKIRGISVYTPNKAVFKLRRM